MRDNDIEGVRYGLHYMYSDDNRFEGNVFRDNAAGAALMSRSGIVLRRNRFLANQGHRSYGVLLQTVEGTHARGQPRSAGNTVGVFFESGHGNRLVGNTIARNHIGIHASDSSDGNEFAGNRFVGNLHTVETTGGNLTSRWAIGGRGNYWDGAVGARSRSRRHRRPAASRARPVRRAAARAARPSACSPAAPASGSCASCTRASRCPDCPASSIRRRSCSPSRP